MVCHYVYVYIYTHLLQRGARVYVYIFRLVNIIDVYKKEKQPLPLVSHPRGVTRIDFLLISDRSGFENLGELN